MNLDKVIYDKPTLEFSQAVAERRKNGGEIISFGLGEPDFKTPDYITEAMFKAINEGFTHYCDSQGLKELRERITKKSNEEHKLQVTSSEIAITPGIKSAAYSAMTSLLKPGDNVLLLTPCYVAYPAMIKMAEPESRILTLDLDQNFSLDLDKLKQIITENDIKLLIVNSPNNPTGAILSRDIIEEIVKLSMENNFYILSDEVYEKITYSEDLPVSFLEYPEIKDRLIVANGFSKSHAMTGWRLGYAIAPESICADISRIQFNTNTNVTTFIQKAACSIFDHKWTHLDEYNDLLKHRVEKFHKFIDQSSLLSGIKPKAGFFYLVNIKKTGMTSNEFASKLVKETGIATTPGLAFGENWDPYIRFSLAVEDEQIDRCIKLMSKFMRDNFEHE